MVNKGLKEGNITTEGTFSAKVPHLPVSTLCIPFPHPLTFKERKKSFCGTEENNILSNSRY